VSKRRRLRLAGRSVERELHGRERTPTVAGQLACIRDARIGREIRPGRHHFLERLERLVVPPELDERVADDAERASRAREQALRPSAVRERPAELVLDERE